MVWVQASFLESFLLAFRAEVLAALEVAGSCTLLVVAAAASHMEDSRCILADRTSDEEEALYMLDCTSEIANILRNTVVVCPCLAADSYIEVAAGEADEGSD